MIINNTLIFEENALQVFAEKIDCTITIILKYHGTIIYTSHFFINDEIKIEENILNIQNKIYLDFFKKIAPSANISFYMFSLKKDKRFKSNNFCAEILSHKIVSKLIDFNFFKE